MSAIQVYQLTRDYNGLRAVGGITFAVEAGPKGDAGRNAGAEIALQGVEIEIPPLSGMVIVPAE